MSQYPAEVDEAIWMLASVGMGPSRIRTALEKDDAGLGSPVFIPPRTLTDKLKRLKEDRGDPADVRSPDGEVDVFGSLRQKVLAKAGRELSVLFDREDPEAKDIDRIGKWMRVVAQVNEDARPKDRQRSEAAKQRQSPGMRELYERIAKSEAEREARLVTELVLHEGENGDA